MKILILIPSLAGGGAERVTTALANYWAQKGHSIIITTFASVDQDVYDLAPEVKRIELGFYNASRNSFIGLIQNFRRVLTIRQMLKQLRPDIAFGMMTGCNILIALSALGLRTIQVLGSERAYPPQYQLGWVWGWLRKKTYRYLKVIVAQTQKSADWLKKNTNVKRVEVIPNPLDWPLKQQSPFVRTDEFLKEGRKILLAAGRLAEEKQHNLLIDCFKSLAARYMNWDLVILGEGDKRQELQSLINNYNLSLRIFLPGRVGNLEDWYKRADIFVLCSRFEGFPNVLVEAMAYKLPVISFDCDTGPGDIIRHQVNGILVPPKDLKGLTQALDQLMDSETVRLKLSEAASEVRERFAINLVADKWEKLFTEIKY